MPRALEDRRRGQRIGRGHDRPEPATYADIADVEATWIDERDEHLNPMGSKGIGEIGIVGTAAAVANAVRLATGYRFRSLPLRIDRVLGAFAQDSRATRA